MLHNSFDKYCLDSFDVCLSTMDGQNVDGNSSAINISDVIEVIETDTAFGSMEPRRPSFEGGSGPYIKIVEQPASKALRFRYECEGRSAGSIPGISSTPENKTFPTIQVMNYKGRAIVVVSCVTKDPPFKPHPHNLVGKEGCKKGVCTVEINNENMIASFANLGIQCVKKKDIEEALKVRESIRVDPFKSGFAHKTQASSIDLNSVRLAFQVFIEGPRVGKFTQPLQPVVSEPIYDKKAMADLVICKLSHCSASVAGGAEVILLCEKVAKEDISVRFFEEKDGQIVWEGFGDFTPAQVHKQVAIYFRTPRYKTLEIDAALQVSIQLRRPSDNATSEALPFLITPLDSVPTRKRPKISEGNDTFRHMPGRLSPNVLPGSVRPVKTEPSEMSSPSHYNFPLFQTTKTSPHYPSRTPSPLDYLGVGSSSGSSIPVPVYQSSLTPNYQPTMDTFTPNYPAMDLQPIPELVGGQYQGQSSVNSLPRVQLPGGSNLLNMDTQEYSIELNLGSFNSKDLAEFSNIDTGNLSANLSNNLTLHDGKRVDDNMTDSLTSLANKTINELCAFNQFPGT